VGAIVIAKRSLGVADDTSLKYADADADWQAPSGLQGIGTRVVRSASASAPPDDATPQASSASSSQPVAGGY
jgi:hypothetical protein